MQSKKAVYILTETKEELDKLRSDYPDIKILYFVDNAIRASIALERRTREFIKGVANGEQSIKPASPGASE